MSGHESMQPSNWMELGDELAVIMVKVEDPNDCMSCDDAGALHNAMFTHIMCGSMDAMEKMYMLAVCLRSMTELATISGKDAAQLVKGEIMDVLIEKLGEVKQREEDLKNEMYDEFQDVWKRLSDAEARLRVLEGRGTRARGQLPQFNIDLKQLYKEDCTSLTPTTMAPSTANSSTHATSAAYPTSFRY
jgi:hypothetical protein